MTRQERNETARSFEKKWHQSKRFIAFFAMEIFLAGLAVLALLTQRPLGWPLASFMTSLVVTMGAVAFGFNGKQADMDKYLRGMVLAANPIPAQEDGTTGGKKDEGEI